MTDTVKIGDAVVHEVLHAHELQKLIREVGGEQLAGTIVTTPSALKPWEVEVGGALNIFGQVHYWEAAVDLRGVTCAKDILDLCKALNDSFEKAAAQVGRP